jgi:hypothetical protein
VEAAWHIPAKPEEVYRVATDFEHWPENFPDIVKRILVVERTPERAVLEVELDMFGVRHRAIMRLQLIPSKGYIAENNSEKLGREVERITLTPAPSGTLYRWENDMRPKGVLLNLLAFLFRPLIRREYEQKIIRRYRLIFGRREGGPTS